MCFITLKFWFIHIFIFILSTVFCWFAKFTIFASCDSYLAQNQYLIAPIQSLLYESGNLLSIKIMLLLKIISIQLILLKRWRIWRIHFNISTKYKQNLIFKVRNTIIILLQLLWKCQFKFHLIFYNWNCDLSFW